MFESISLKPYIDSGYTLEIPYRDEHEPKYSRIEGQVSELTPDQLIMLGPTSLRFESLPTLSKNHRFTVTMTADDGREFKASIDMRFD